MFSNDVIHRIGILVCILSVITTFTLFLTVNSIWQRANSFKSDVMSRSHVFGTKSQVIWAEMSEMSRTLRIPRDYGREATAEQGKKGVLHKCSQCSRLHCPAGQPGNEGPPGQDGEPGAPGKSGVPGIDGEDIELDTQPDMPCRICPAGPPGSRGPQGERGRNGKQGTPGRHGDAGNPGIPGAVGTTGFPGHVGAPGSTGARGPPGDNAIAGEGIKGPRGVPGVQGAKGPPGTPGRPSNVRGAPGSTGPRGGIGQTGKFGAYGETGPAGPTGEPGLPSPYCPSDCGVSKIVSAVGMEFEQNSSPSGYAQQPETAAHKTFEEMSYRNFFVE
ncbi:DumPY: shorter than wild-type [Trichostrongylus colubriformis]|uniref:DumPY: shorter than wild-type n=1 Tax=Trichostrongylus colubriformis TaxID=6319 RepID=A0AAN8G8Y4_TRICO